VVPNLLWAPGSRFSRGDQQYLPGYVAVIFPKLSNCTEKLTQNGITQYYTSFPVKCKRLSFQCIVQGINSENPTSAA